MGTPPIVPGGVRYQHVVKVAFRSAKAIVAAYLRDAAATQVRFKCRERCNRGEDLWHILRASESLAYCFAERNATFAVIARRIDAGGSCEAGAAGFATGFDGPPCEPP